MKPSEVIERYGWCQNSMGSTKAGFCCLGAICYAQLGKYQTDEAIHKLHDIFPRQENGDYTSITSWNDFPGRTKEEVIKALKSINL